MKNNYPIGYCVLPISEKVRVANGIAQGETICYIAMKCFVVGEEKEYTSFGDIYKKYKVVPTYKEDGWGMKFYRDEPKYKFGKCVNYVYTETVFKTKKEAEKIRDEKNEDLIRQKERYLLESTNIGDKIRKTIDGYKEMEESIEENTTYLDGIKDKFKEQEMFCVCSDFGLLKEGHSVYELIDSNSIHSDYAVYTVTKEEYEELNKIERNDDVNDLIRSKNLARFMHTPLMLCSYEDDFAKLLPPKVGKNKSIYILLGNGAIPIAKRKSYKYIDWDEIYFTMETYDDIVESYNIGFKRKDELTLKMKKEDIWTNDKYKY